jgi:hypothetical protein
MRLKDVVSAYASMSASGCLSLETRCSAFGQSLPLDLSMLGTLGRLSQPMPDFAYR